MAPAQFEQPTPAPAAGGEAPVVGEAPAAPPSIVETNEETRPAQHQLPPPAPTARSSAPPQAAQPARGDVLLQADDNASWGAAIEPNGEGNSPATHCLPPSRKQPSPAVTKP